MKFCQWCNDCFKNNEKCDYCDQVYFSGADYAEVDGKDWINCDGCDTWNHPDCEIELGKDAFYREAA